MANGIANKWRTDPLRKPIVKLLQLCVKYDYQGDKLDIDNRILLQELENGSGLVLCINDNPFFRMCGGTTREVVSWFVNGFTLGVIDVNGWQFATSDKTVTNRKYVKGVADAIERNLPRIEQMLKDSSEKRWK